MHQDLGCAPQRAANDLAEIVPRGIGHDDAGFQLGHVQEVGDKAIEPLGLVDHGGEQVALLDSVRPLERSRMVEAAPSTEANGVLRSCEIEVKSAARKRSDSTVRLTRSMSSTSCTRSIASAPWSTSASSKRP